MKRVAPYGTWLSPISAELVAGNAKRFAQLELDGDRVYWTESRPAEGGRYALMAMARDGSVHELSSPAKNVRTRVHEYGGGAFTAGKGVVAFANFDDQIVYRIDEQRFHPITIPGMRYADGAVDAQRNRIICVREDHTGHGEAVNTLVAFNVDVQDPGRVLASGYDFYSTPSISPDGLHLSWLSWNHPEMPWTRTQLWVAELDDEGGLTDSACIVDGDESVFQPEWSPDGALYFVSDRSGWWNLYRWVDGRIEQVLQMEAEFGRPQWVFGMPTYGFRDANSAVCSYTKDGSWRLAEVDLASGALTELDQPYTTVRDVHVNAERAVFVGGAPDAAEAIVQLDFGSGEMTVLQKSSDLVLPDGFLSTPEPVSFPAKDGAVSHALFYAPQNKEYAAHEIENPPLIVISHGGPTGATASDLNLGIQFWTSRGFAVLDVNYGGSTGYGRAYRERLDDKWGVVDVDDCISGAEFLATQGRVDGERMLIRGGSAGGYTTLAALTFRDVFRAGASYYGVSDLGGLATETHKFESRYLDGLVGPYPERKDIYEARSPLYHVDQLSCPIIFLQGLEDKVVLPNQAEMMVDALRKKGIPVAYLAYEGEQHGFRRAENIARSLTAELYFYGRVLGLPISEELEPVDIENLPAG